MAKSESGRETFKAKIYKEQCDFLLNIFILFLYFKLVKQLKLLFLKREGRSFFKLKIFNYNKRINYFNNLCWIFIPNSFVFIKKTSLVFTKKFTKVLYC